MSEQSYFERELVQRLAEVAPPAAPGAAERARLAIVNVPQRRGLFRLVSATGSAPWMQAAAAVVVVMAAVVVGYALGLLSPRVGDGPSPTPSPSRLPALTMPGMSVNNPAGEFGWTGLPGMRTGMHKVVEVGDGVNSRMTQVVFAVEKDCFASGEGPEPTPVTVAGLDGWYVEPYDAPGVLFMPERKDGQTTGAYAMPIGELTLCVYLTWDASTTPDELDAAREVVESIRAQVVETILGQADSAAIRINFTLPEDWDTG